MGMQVGSTNYTTPVRGQRQLTNIQTDRKVPQIEGEYDINPNSDPVTQLTKKLGRARTVRQQRFGWVERDEMPQTVTTTAAQLEAGTGTVDLASGQGKNVQKGSVLWCERTGEHMLVTTTPAADAVAVTRGWMGDAAIIAVGGTAEELTLMAPAFVEGSDAPSGQSNEPKLLYNTCQTMRMGVECSRRDEFSENYGDLDEMERMKRVIMNNMRFTKERSILFNSEEVTSDPSAAMGFEGFIATNVNNQAGVLDEASLNAWCFQARRRNPDDMETLYNFWGENFGKALDGFGRDYLRLAQDDTKLGLKIETWRCSAGSFKGMVHPQLGPLFSSVTGANKGRIGKFFSLQLKKCREVHYEGGDLAWDPNWKTPGVDGKKGGWTEDWSIEVASEKHHTRAYGITG